MSPGLYVADVNREIQLVTEAIDVVDDVNVLTISGILLLGPYFWKVRLIPDKRELIREVFRS